MDPDLRLREAAIRHCRMLAQVWGEAVPARELTKGFDFEGQRVNLVARRRSREAAFAEGTVAMVQRCRTG